MCIIIRLEGVPSEDNAQDVYHVIYPALAQQSIQTNQSSDAVLPTAPPFDDIDDNNTVAPSTVNGQHSTRFTASADQQTQQKTFNSNANWNILKMWSNNWREFLPILPGLLLIFASGSQFISTIHLIMDYGVSPIWTINITNDFRFFHFHLSMGNISDISVWFAGVIIGSILAAFTVSKKPKWTIYVRINIRAELKLGKEGHEQPIQLIFSVGKQIEFTYAEFRIEFDTINISCIQKRV